MFNVEFLMLNAAISGIGRWPNLATLKVSAK
jgi:hypothetical protein